MIRIIGKFTYLDSPLLIRLLAPERVVDQHDHKDPDGNRPDRSRGFQVDRGLLLAAASSAKCATLARRSYGVWGVAKSRKAPLLRGQRAGVYGSATHRFTSRAPPRKSSRRPPYRHVLPCKSLHTVRAASQTLGAFGRRPCRPDPCSTAAAVHCGRAMARSAQSTRSVEHRPDEV